MRAVWGFLDPQKRVASTSASFFTSPVASTTAGLAIKLLLSWSGYRSQVISHRTDAVFK